MKSLALEDFNVMPPKFSQDDIPPDFWCNDYISRLQEEVRQESRESEPPNSEMQSPTNFETYFGCISWCKLG